uniref:Transmembrane protein n=1 Tax=Ulva flexuosa TaxID=83791 RepID=A0A247ZLG9_9CHLO|nr:hypothetical protein [Ulva flexuosa]AQS79878.1 hypothetical protein [Ulva flexuosa]ATP01436.1 hypothetical protein [Ulva flexuosa]AZP40209.1 hypothetical protein [Ulva flexuosa]
MSIMTTILLEICYRNFYIASVFLLMQCFSYFTQGFQLEFFSGLFVTSFQAVDFNFYNNIIHHSFAFEKLNHQPEAEQLLSGTIKPIQNNYDYLSVYSDKFHSRNKLMTYQYEQPINNFIALSSNEAKTWSCLFIIYLNYFYCIQLNEAVLNFLLLYTKLEYLIPFIIIHYYSSIKPGLLNKQKFWFFQIILGLALFAFIVNQYTILTVIAIFEEFKLEQLDSELI